jgi:threonine/homoserine/homoserine lactone efflux protein
MLALGLTLGAGAGLAPGPILALVVRSTLHHGLAAGVRVAFSPLLTDLPIILLALTVAGALPEPALGVLGIVGGGFVIWLGIAAAREKPLPSDTALDPPAPRSDLFKGAMSNILSPHPWVFWITVGAPILSQGGLVGGVVFLCGFYLMLIGTKAAIAVVVSVGRQRLLQGRGYVIVLRISALLLIAAGVFLGVEGLLTLM